jgi:hypothetical protein
MPSVIIALRPDFSPSLSIFSKLEKALFKGEGVLYNGWALILLCFMAAQELDSYLS